MKSLLASEKAREILGQYVFEQLQEAGICFLWDSEAAFLIFAANNADQSELTYKGLDQMQGSGVREGQALKAVQIRKVEERESRKLYPCQCGLESCQLEIKPKELYIRLKLVEKQFGERKNKEKTISKSCAWYEHWKAFLK